METEKCAALYEAASKFMTRLGVDGVISAGSAEANGLGNALYDLDGVVYIPEICRLISRRMKT